MNDSRHFAFKEFFANAKNTLKRRQTTAKADYDRKTVFFKPKENMEKVEVIIGTVLRSAVMFCAVFGLCVMYFDAVGIYRQNPDFRQYSLPLLPLAAVCLALSLALGFVRYNRITALCVPAASALFFIGVPAVLHGNIITFYADALRLIWNESVECIAQRRFTSFSNLEIAGGYCANTETLMMWGSFAVSAVLAFVLYFAFYKKATALFAATYFVVWFPLFIFNLPSSNTGFALSASAIFGFIAVRSCDKRLDGTLDKKVERREMGRIKRLEARNEAARRKIDSLKIRTAGKTVYKEARAAGVEAKKARAAARSAVRILRAAKREEEKARKKESRLEAKRRRVEEKRLKKEERKNRGEIKKELRKNKGTLSPEAESLKKSLEESKAEKKRLAVIKKNARAVSGFAGGLSLVLALLAIWIPASTAKKSFKTVDFINDKVKILRQLTDDLLMSDDVDLTRNDLYSYPEVFGYETLTFDKREYDGTLIYYVESASTDTVYLKTRTALDYNFAADTWLFADNTKVIDTSRKFGTEFSPNDITSSLYTLLYPGSENVPESGEINAYEGVFSTEHIHVMRVNGKSKLLAVPSVMNSNRGLMERGSAESAKYAPTSYFDGIYTSRHYGKDSAGYSTLSYIYDMKNADAASVISDTSNAVNALSVLSEKYKKGSDKVELKDEFVNSVTENSRFIYLADSYIDSYTDEERQYVDSLLESEEKYREFVLENYSAKSESEDIAALSAKLTDAEDTRYGKVMSVIRYLTGGEYVYTLEPVGKADSEQGVLSNFLFETHEGYCSHFTTAAVVLLREAGVPARYAEGYIARGFFEGYGNNKTEKYSSNVFDENSHTWLEVYFDGIGWIPFETTPFYATEVYGGTVADPETKGDGETDEITPPPSSERPIETMPVVIPDIDETPEMSVLERFRSLIIAVGIVILLIIAYRIVRRIIVKKANVYVKRKYDIIADAKNEAVYRDKSRDKKEIERFLNDNILMILRAVGIGPEKGELSEEFGERLVTEYGGMSTKDARLIMSYIRKSEFGGDLTFTELSDTAEYLADITVSLYSGMSPIKKFAMRYVRHLI